MNEKLLVVGIDPGATGAVCYAEYTEQGLHYHRIYSMEKWWKSAHLNLPTVSHYFMEAVHGSPALGARNFPFGRSLGRIEGLLWGRRVYFVTPQRWQHALECSQGAKKSKAALKRRAVALGYEIPNQDLADAALIAHFAYLCWRNKTNLPVVRIGEEC